MGHNKAKIEDLNRLLTTIRDNVQEIKTTEKLLMNSDYENKAFDQAVNFWDNFYLLTQTIKGFKKIEDLEIDQTLATFDMEGYKIDLDTTQECLDKIRKTEMCALSRDLFKRKDQYEYRDSNKKTHVEEIFDTFQGEVEKNFEWYGLLCKIGQKELEQHHKQQILSLFEIQKNYDTIEIPRVPLLFGADWKQKEEQLDRICEQAHGQYYLLRQMEEIRHLQENNDFVLKELEGTEAVIFDEEKLADDACEVLSHLQKIEAFQDNPYIATIKKDVLKLQGQLNVLKDYLALIQLMQAAYVKMAKKFFAMANPDQIELETGPEFQIEVFTAFEQVWHALISRVRENPKVIALVEQTDVYTRLQNFNRTQLKALREQ